MNGTNLFKIALRALANNKLRAFLTMLGIIIGVASVIAMLAIGQGSKKSIQQQISEMGSNRIMIHPGAEMRGGTLIIDGDVRIPAANMSKGTCIVRGVVHEMLPTFEKIGEKDGMVVFHGDVANKGKGELLVKGVGDGWFR